MAQDRESGFYPGELEKEVSSEQALTLALAEVYAQGVYTYKVKSITEQHRLPVNSAGQGLR
jgi:transposase-like protein